MRSGAIALVALVGACRHPAGASSGAAASSEAAAGANTPAGVLKDVDVWVPDWNGVLTDLDADVAAYQKATGS